MWGWWGIMSLEHGSLARPVMVACVTLLCISLFPAQRRWINLHPQSRIKRGVPVLGFCCFLITGLLGLGTSEPGITHCWACGTQHPLIYQIFSFCKLFISQREQSSVRHPAYNLFKQMLHFYCCHPYMPKSCSVFTTPFQSPKLTETVHKRVIFLTHFIPGITFISGLYRE